MRILCAAILTIACSGCATVPGDGVSRVVLGTHRLTQTDEHDGFVESEDEHEEVLRTMRTMSLTGGAAYRGKARAAAKTSLPDAKLEIFTSVAALRKTLPSDDDMRDHDPKISTTAASERVDEEMRMVRVSAQLLAISKETDNDYHLIVADPACRSGDCRLNVEVSGLPSSRSEFYAPLKSARDDLEAAIEGPIGSGYAKLDPPVDVLIEGALFYDIDHGPGLVGPTGMRPDTSWEIHPISHLELR